MIYSESFEAPSSKDIVKIFEPIFQDCKIKTGLSDETFYKLMVALTEGLNNASCHGNCYDQNKIIGVNIESDGEWINCTIRDEGEGFELEEIADPRHPENLLKESGRGVFLMKTLSDEFSAYKKDGFNFIELKFKI